MKLNAIEGGRKDLLNEAWGCFIEYCKTDDPEAGAKFVELVRRTSGRAELSLVDSE